MGDRSEIDILHAEAEHTELLCGRDRVQLLCNQGHLYYSSCSGHWPRDPFVGSQPYDSPYQGEVRSINLEDGPSFSFFLFRCVDVAADPPESCCTVLSEYLIARISTLIVTP